MTNEFDITSLNIPCGELHDQELSLIKRENNKMIFTFDVDFNTNDYLNDSYKKYLPYKHCDMIVEMVDEASNSYEFCSFLHNGKFSGILLKDDDLFLDIMKNVYNSSFLDCSYDYNEFSISMYTSFYGAKGKYKKYKKYPSLSITLEAKKVIWKWY